MDKYTEPAEISQISNMKNKLIGLGIYILVFILGVSSTLITKHFISSRKSDNEIPKNVLPEITSKISLSEYTTEPPSKALVGIINASGSARIQKRENTNWLPITNSDNVYQEERIILDEGNLSLKFGKTTISSHENESEIYLANLMPESFLLSQTSGIFTYTTDESMTIKATEALIKLSQGQAKVEVNKLTEEVTVKLVQGNSEIAIIDASNTTRVYKLAKNEAAVINASNRVRIIK